MSAEDRLIARYFAPLATHPGALGLVRRRRLHQAAAGLRSGAQDRRHHRRRAFFPRRCRAATVASKALRVNLSDLAAKGANAARLPAVAGAAEGDRRRLACRFRRRLARRRGALRLSAVRRRHRPHAGPDHDFHRHVRQRAGRHHGAPRRRQARRPRVRERHASAMPRSALRCAKAPDWKLSEPQRQHLAVALSVAAAAQRAGRGRAHARLGRHGRVGWAGRRSRQAVRASRRSRPTSRSARVPLSDAAQGGARRRRRRMLETALTGGDDYEIVCTVPPAKAESFRAAAQSGARSR